MILAAPRVPILLLLAITIVPASVRAEEADRVLRKEITIDATIEEVWHAWTSAEGLAPVAGPCNVELRVGGPYEWFLVGEPDESGRRGGEGARVLAFLPHEMLAFDWTFPPAVPALRASGAKTQVVLLFDELAEGGVRVRFAQHGWGEGEDHDRGYEYFDRAWSWVLQTMKKSLETAE